MQKITKAKLCEILNLRHKENPYAKLSNMPSPESFKDIKKATARVKEAILNNEKITIVGDYDVDGVISTAIMVDFFKQIHYPIKHIIPNRFEHGYGLSPKIIDLIDEGLVITVDNGISALNASKLLKEKKIDLIITDHHTVPEELPYATAIINPKQEDCQFPFKEICGAQVAWYFCVSIKTELNLNVDMSSFLDLLSVAIIADIMPMTSLNYTLVKHGLKKIKTSQRPAFLELNEVMQKNAFTSDDIGFLIAPKINSAGRMDDASLALDFLLSSTQKEAKEALDVLNELNNYRKLLQEDISQKAQMEVNENENAIIVWGEHWHEGVIGIVASKLSSKYKKPAFIFSINEGIAKGSARANGDINLHTIISCASDLLLGFGGHKNAAGLSLKQEHLEAFKTTINEAISQCNETLHIELDTLGELDINSVDMEFIDLIENYEPYGLDNLRPVFKISNAQVVNTVLFGKDKNHLKLFLNTQGCMFEAIMFNEKEMIKEDSIDLIVSLNKNEFRGDVKAQFLVQQIL
ncbi:MAG: single-stranded-DNA-specific exonuclease RecJ [Candidatus Marinarcus sp.]|uniref:single-stranded-DNA-specific exonuclease RecJ n=1 Tax=Candidatus Marinarcus sp. TaxID=3100987 RepID=UPI003B00D638